MTGKYHDRFSKAFEELDDKNAYVCHTCGSTDVRRAGKRGEGKGEQKHEDENVSLRIARSRTEKAIFSDPSPLGP